MGGMCFECISKAEPIAVAADMLCSKQVKVPRPTHRHANAKHVARAGVQLANQLESVVRVHHRMYNAMTQPYLPNQERRVGCT